MSYYFKCDVKWIWKIWLKKGHKNNASNKLDKEGTVRGPYNSTPTAFFKSSVNVNKSAGNCKFGHIYWRNP